MRPGQPGDLRPPISPKVLQDTFVRLWNSPERFDPERGAAHLPAS
ncbi:MAG: hypothetical protein IPH81_08945 [Candidatus Microthrix sp.]|nr:hypothetical protein [Candidatus Microthrix sp.]